MVTVFGKSVWKVIVWTLNCLLLTVLIVRTFQIDNDKAPVLFSFYYAVILLINLILWFSFSFTDKTVKAEFKTISLTLLLIFIPLLILISEYS